jgi:hypothetical protein
MISAEGEMVLAEGEMAFPTGNPEGIRKIVFVS